MSERARLMQTGFIWPLSYIVLQIILIIYNNLERIQTDQLMTFLRLSTFVWLHCKQLRQLFICWTHDHLLNSSQHSAAKTWLGSTHRKERTVSPLLLLRHLQVEFSDLLCMLTLLIQLGLPDKNKTKHAFHHYFHWKRKYLEALRYFPSADCKALWSQPVWNQSKLFSCWDAFLLGCLVF